MNVNTKNGNNINDQEKLIVVKRATQFDDGKIAFDMIVNDVTIYGCMLIDGKNGLFISFPRRRGINGKYYNFAYVSLSEADMKNIIAQIEKL